MMDTLWSVASRLWQPWLAIAVLGVALIITLATGFVQLRGLPRAVREALAVRREQGSGGIVAAGVAAGSGIASLGAGALAVELAGPGALPWIWIVVALAMAVAFAQTAVPHDEPTGGAAPSGLRRAWWLAALLGAAATAGVMQGREGGALLEQTWGIAPLVGAVAFAIAAVPFVVSLGARRLLLAAVPWALVAAIVALGTLVAADSLALSLALGDAYEHAFGLAAATGGSIAGGIAIALAEGTRAAALAGGVLHGVARVGHRRAMMLAPLLGAGVITTLGALTVMTEPERPSIVERDVVPLERPHSRGLRPAAPPFGQTVVLPVDTPLQDSEHYAFVVRSNPRGNAMAKLDVEHNSVLLPAWAITADTHEVVFRPRDPEAAKLGSWDVRVPCNRRLVDAPGGEQILELTPVNADLELKKLLTYYELDKQAYVPLADYHFIGKVAVAQSADPTLGEHLAMFEAPRADRPDAPELHEFFRTGYRGPYADTGEPRPPWGFVGVDGFTAPAGTRLDLRLPASPRGEPFVRLNRVGGAEAPPWDFLMGARELVLQHESDPSLDIVLAIDTELDGFRIRLKPRDPEWSDFRKLEQMKGYRKVPFVRVRDFDFAAEVHGDTRLESRWGGRTTIVPLVGELTEPQGPHGDWLPYAPHPSELVAMGMHGPVLARNGSARIGGRLFDTAPGWARGIGALALFVLGLASVAATSMLLHRDPMRQRVIGVAIAIATVAGGMCSWKAAYAIASIGGALAIVLGAAVVLGQLGAIRRGD